jgi:hypothetical protein
MIVYKREQVVDVNALREKLFNDFGISGTRYFKQGIGFLRSIRRPEFRNYIDLREPLLYMAPIPEHNVMFAIQGDRIVVKADNERHANEMIDAFNSRYGLR